MIDRVAKSLVSVIGSSSWKLGKVARGLSVSDLFGIDDFEFCLELPDAFSTLRISKDGTDVNAFDLSGPGGLRLPRLLQYIANGHSCIIHGLENKLPQIRSLCKLLEESIDSPVSCNCYFTPGGGNAFPPHTDPHDVIVLHIGGSKLWHFGDSLHTTTEYRMEPGDILFLSKGIVHYANQEAETADLYSLHLTFAVMQEDAGSVGAEVARIMHNDTALNIEEGVRKYNLEEIGRREIELLDWDVLRNKEESRKLIASAVERLRTARLNKRISNLDNGILSILIAHSSGGLDLSSRLRITKQPFVVIDGGDRIRVLAKDMAFTLPLKHEFIVKLLNMKEPFSIGELPVADGKEELLILCQLLAARGIIGLSND